MKECMINCRFWGRSIRALAVSLMLALLGVVGLRTMQAHADVDRVTAHPNLSLSRARRVLRQARHLRPDWSRVWRLEGQWLAMNHPRRARIMARRAVQLNPENWRNWHDLGMLDYQLGDPARAQFDLEQSARYNAGFLAHFQAANLAFLLGNQPLFWREMAVALRMVPSNQLLPVMQQINHLEGNHPQAWLGMLPASRIGLRATAIHFLIRVHDLSAAVSIWRKLPCPAYRRLACHDAALDLSRAWLHRAIADSSAAAKSPPAQPHTGNSSLPGFAARQARQVWNQAVRRRVLSASILVTGSVNDGNFQFPWRGGLSWRPGPGNLLQFRHAASRNVNRVVIRLDGYEPGHLLLMRQWAIFQPGRHYNISFQTRGRNLFHARGISLDLYTPQGLLVKNLPAAVVPAWRVNQTWFMVPPHAPLIRIDIRYDRPYGTALMRGRVEIGNVASSPALKIYHSVAGRPY